MALQKRALLFIHKQLGWKTVGELIDSESNIMVFKSFTNLVPQYLHNLFTRMSQLPSVNLRNTTTDLKLPRKNSKSGQKGFSFRGAKLWNGLPVESEQVTSLNASKSS